MLGYAKENQQNIKCKIKDEDAASEEVVEFVMTFVREEVNEGHYNDYAWM